MTNYQITITLLADEGDDPIERVVASIDAAVALVREVEPSSQHSQIETDLNAWDWREGGDGWEYTNSQVYIELTDEPVTPLPLTNRQKALEVAFGTFASNSDDIADKELALQSRNDFEQANVIPAQRFEDFDNVMLREEIDSLAVQVEAALVSTTVRDFKDPFEAGRLVSGNPATVEFAINAMRDLVGTHPFDHGLEVKTPIHEGEYLRGASELLIDMGVVRHPVADKQDDAGSDSDDLKDYVKHLLWPEHFKDPFKSEPEYTYSKVFTDTELHAAYEALDGLPGTGLEYLDWLDANGYKEVPES